jgi:dolichyl-phosphate-mannose--protein O-mannosyl transferase
MRTDEDATGEPPVSEERSTWAPDRPEGDVDGGAPDAPVRADRADRHRKRPWWGHPVVVVLAVTAFAGGLRFYQVSYPKQFVFDEVYYAKDGCYDAGIPFRDCQLTAPGEQTVTVHPPLGRWIIAAGIKVTGGKPADFHCAPDSDDGLATCNPFPFRVASAAFGTLSVALLTILAYLLFSSSLWAFVAGLLLATENLNFVQSRMSMLDIFVATFVVAGFLFLVLDRRWMERRTPPRQVLTPEEQRESLLLDLPPDRPPSPVFRPWRLAAGLAFGAAMATKWSGATALAGAIVLALAWERTRRSNLGLRHPFREALRDELFGIVVFLAIVPMAVYLASYLGWFAQNDWNLGAWWKLQHQMATFSLTLRTPHPYASPPWAWPLMARPVAYYYQCVTTVGGQCTRSAEILGMGSPAIFWGSLFALPYALYAWIRKRDWRPGLIVVAFASQYFPWFATHRTSFLFYMTPITPFMVLAVTYGLRDLAEIRVGEERAKALMPIVALCATVCVVVFIFFLPILTGRIISEGQRVARMWFRSWT